MVYSVQPTVLLTKEQAQAADEAFDDGNLETGSLVSNYSYESTDIVLLSIDDLALNYDSFSNKVKSAYDNITHTSILEKPYLSVLYGMVSSTELQTQRIKEIYGESPKLSPRYSSLSFFVTKDEAHKIDTEFDDGNLSTGALVMAGKSNINDNVFLVIDRHNEGFERMKRIVESYFYNHDYICTSVEKKQTFEHVPNVWMSRFHAALFEAEKRLDTECPAIDPALGAFL